MGGSNTLQHGAVQLSVEVTHEKLVVEEEIEVSL
jgi:hypothetical protein